MQDRQTVQYKFPENRRRTRARKDLNKQPSLKLDDIYLIDSNEHRVFSTFELDEYHKQLSTNSDEKDRDNIEKIISEIVTSVQPKAIFILLESALYFDNLGDTIRALEVARIGLNFALRTEEIDLKRKAHNIIGVMYTRACDYTQACSHLETALGIAVQQRNRFYEFAILCNVVLALKAMGLFADAKILALRLTQYPRNTQLLNQLHLQNAINGLGLSKTTSDLQSAEVFVRLGESVIQTAGNIGAPWRAYFSAQQCLYLLQAGRLSEANKVVRSAIELSSNDANLRVNVALQCAKAYCAIEAKNANQISDSCAVLTELLARAKNYSCHCEEILRALVDLHRKDKTVRGKLYGLRYLRQLNAHLVNVKHRQFFQRISRAIEYSDLSSCSISSPYYNIALSLTSDNFGSNELENKVSRMTVSDVDHVQNKALNFIESSRRKIEKQYRSSLFDVAEDWAVASDFTTEREGAHCFQVGRLSGLIAENLGFSKQQTVLIEMACRLHDIGKLAISKSALEAASSGSVDDYFTVREHTLAGAHMLSSHADEVFLVAARVARHHHEWWNGFGYPDSLSGVRIPLEARICAVADVYVALLYPPTNRSRWDRDGAARQVLSMAGVQLDPGLMEPFIDALENSENLEFAGLHDGPLGLEHGSLRSSKSRLLNMINLLN